MDVDGNHDEQGSDHHPQGGEGAAGPHAGTKVTFTRNADGDFVLSTTQPSLMGLRGRLRHVGPAVSLETMDDAIAAGATEDS